MYNTFNNFVHRNICIVGDFNINLHSHYNNITVYFNDTFYSMNFISLITKSNHLYSNGNSLIDNIFTNFKKDLFYNIILITDISDHLHIFSIFDLLKNKINDTLYWNDIYSCSNINFNHVINI